MWGFFGNHLIAVKYLIRKIKYSIPHCSFTNDHMAIGRGVHDVSVGRMTKKKKIHVVRLSLLQGTQIAKLWFLYPIRLMEITLQQNHIMTKAHHIMRKDHKMMPKAHQIMKKKYMTS